MTESVGPSALVAQLESVAPLSSVHTTTFPEILRRLHSSLLVTTYQAGKLIVLRADGAALNTHFVNFRKPMGLAVDGQRLFIGTDCGISEFRNFPNLSERLSTPKRRDAVYVLRNHHVTGNIEIHEMGFGADPQCWYVNTRFSCLCTLDYEHSFVPRWRPRFISSLAPEDRCHLNGLAMVDGKPRFVTALGATDTPQGWRHNKKAGGILLDVESRESIAHGLSMPHSPRWYRDRLWLLESGTGSLVTVDLASGKIQTVARLPGFARGLDLIGPLAFVGLSQLRDSNAFTQIPITDQNADRLSGVWVVNIETGQTMAFLQFGDAIQEIFDVRAIPGILFPEILDAESELLQTTYALPDAALKQLGLGLRP